jgi:hypothetical protein
MMVRFRRRMEAALLSLLDGGNFASWPRRRLVIMGQKPQSRGLRSGLRLGKGMHFTFSFA